MKQLGLFLETITLGLVRGPADDRGLWPFKKGVLSVHARVQSLVGNKDLVRFLNVRMNGIGAALQQWGMGSARCLQNTARRGGAIIMAIVGLIEDSMAKK